jgi:hypothetical protein
MKAIYHQEAGVSHEFDVINDHKDGTVDLGRGNEVRVHRCFVSDSGAPGTARLIGEDKPKADKKPSKKQLQTAAVEARAAADAANVAAVTAKDAADQAPDDEALALAANEAYIAFVDADHAALEAEAAAAK